MTTRMRAMFRRSSTDRGGCSQCPAPIQPKAAAVLAALCLSTLALTGCLTQHQLIEHRIGQKADFFATLPAESQQRLREGHVRSGDSRDAAWIVYGKPDRVFQKTTASATNEVWSYISQQVSDRDEYRPVYYPIRTSASKTIWRLDSINTEPTRFDTYEYLRIEFDGDRVSTIQTEQP